MDRRVFLAAVGAGFGPGCLRFADGGSTAATAADGEPSGPSPTAAEDYPTGLTASGVEPILLDAHASTLVDETFTAALSLRNATDLEGRMMEARIGADAISGTFEDERSADAYGVRQGQAVLWRQRHAGSWTYGRYRESITAERVLSSITEELRPILAAVRFDRPEVRTDDRGNRYFHLSASAPDPEGGRALAERQGLAELTGVDLEGTVSPAGIIVALGGDLTFRDGDGGTVLVQVEYETSAVGSTTVSEPSWVATARERAPQIEATAVDDRRGVRFDHTGGGPVVADTAVVINEYEARGYHEYRLERPLAAGERLYAAIADGELRVSSDGVPAGASSGPIASRDGHAGLRYGSFYYTQPDLGEL